MQVALKGIQASGNLRHRRRHIASLGDGLSAAANIVLPAAKFAGPAIVSSTAAHEAFVQLLYEPEAHRQIIETFYSVLECLDVIPDFADIRFSVFGFLA